MRVWIGGGECPVLLSAPLPHFLFRSSAAEGVTLAYDTSGYACSR